MPCAMDGLGHLQVSKEEGLTAWFVAAAIGSSGHETASIDRVLRIVEFRTHAFGNINLIETPGLRPVLCQSRADPTLECACVL